MVTLQLIRLPKSPGPRSHIPSVQVPFTFAGFWKPAHEPVFVGRLLGPTPTVLYLSALKIPVLGAGAPLIAGRELSELNTVFVKFGVLLLPVPPSIRPTRLITSPVGLPRFITRSPEYVCVIVKVSLTSVITAFEGIPLTVTVRLIPFGVLSGTAAGKPAEALKTAVVGEVALVSVSGRIVPRQIVALVGLTVATSGTTVKVAGAVKSIAVQGLE